MYNKQLRTVAAPHAAHAPSPSNRTIKSKLNGNDASVTVTTSPGSTSSLNGRSRFGRVASSSCGGAWRYRDLVARRREGRRICLRGAGGIFRQFRSGEQRRLYAGERERASARANAQVLPLKEHVDQVLQRARWVARHGDLLAAADGTFGLLLVLERVGVDRVVARVHPVRREGGAGEGPLRSLGSLERERRTCSCRGRGSCSSQS